MMHPYIKYLEHPKFHLKHPLTGSLILPWKVPELCLSYGWPIGLKGGGVIAIVELGGGWVKSDVAQFCGRLGHPLPSITDVSVDGIAGNNGDVTDPASGEVALDIQVAAASYFMATGKPAAIRMYWVTNSADGIAKAVAMAAADGCDVCSISWGADEASWGPAEGHFMEGVAIQATAGGMAIFAASGDNDSSDGGSNPSNVDLPASCPHIVGCGGTHRPHYSPSRVETVWNNDPGQTNGEGTGGGFSRFFPAQQWQQGAPRGSRMVPDVAANADPMTGYRIVLGGQEIVVGGTSAVAPLYAGLFAAIGRKLGFVTPTLWAWPGVFNDIVVGDNGAYEAVPGPDPCTGLGSPDAWKIAGLFHPLA